MFTPPPLHEESSNPPQLGEKNSLPPRQCAIGPTGLYCSLPYAAPKLWNRNISSQQAKARTIDKFKEYFKK